MDEGRVEWALKAAASGEPLGGTTLSSSEAKALNISSRPPSQLPISPNNRHRFLPVIATATRPRTGRKTSPTGLTTRKARQWTNAKRKSTSTGSPTATSATCSNPSTTRCKKPRSKNVRPASPPLLPPTHSRVFNLTSPPPPAFSLPLPKSADERPVPAVHELTDICWRKCVTGAISSSGLDRKEEPCVRNCVERFLDANEAVLKHLSVMRGQGGV